MCAKVAQKHEKCKRKLRFSFHFRVLSKFGEAKVTKKNMNNMSGIIIFFLPLLPIKQHKTLKL